MLELTQGRTSETIILTLNEKKTLADPDYTFKCTHITTKEEVSFTLGVDLSLYPNRYNSFTIYTGIDFLNATPGQYLYEVTEQTTDVVVEQGRLVLNKAVDFNFTGYSPETTYSGYGG